MSKIRQTVDKTGRLIKVSAIDYDEFLRLGDCGDCGDSGWMGAIAEFENVEVAT